MRRALLVPAVAAPLAVLAAISTAPSGKVVELDNYSTTEATSYINAAQCADTEADPLLNLQWSTIITGGAATGSDTYQIYASNTAPAATGERANLCPETDDPNVSPPVKAGQVDFAAWESNIQGKLVSGSEAASLADVDCSESGEGDVLYICAHLKDGADVIGYASGKFIVQVAAPDAPGGVSAGAASETSLAVRWSGNRTGVRVDHYVAEATADGGTTVFRSGRTTGTDATISGLTEGTTYSVVVYAYSLGGNESGPSQPEVLATPGPVDDFWETYQRAGGADDGGCASGPGGPFALVAVGALLLLRRRK